MDSGTKMEPASMPFDLSTKEFVSTHRPKLRVRRFKAHNIDVRRPLVLQYEAFNIGDTNAHVVQHTPAVQTFARRGEPKLDAKSIPITEPIAAGGARLVRWEAKQIVYDGN
jgi:hypothetical protein